MKRAEMYRFRDGLTPLNEKELNSRFFDIDNRLTDLEETKIGWLEAILELQNTGLKRLNDAVIPLVSSVQAMANDIAIKAEYEAGASIVYDGSGRVIEVDYQINDALYSITYTYNISGNVQTETGKLDGETLWVRTYNYDQQGNITGWTVDR